ncbi:hypothetical protein N0Y54_43370 [Nostoc punctiforme UO1]
MFRAFHLRRLSTISNLALLVQGGAGSDRRGMTLFGDRTWEH